MMPIVSTCITPKSPLHGLPIEKIKGRFEFAEGNWSTLEEQYPPNVIPAAVDQNTMMWSLKKGEETGFSISIRKGIRLRLRSQR